MTIDRAVLAFALLPAGDHPSQAGSEAWRCVLKMRWGCGLVVALLAALAGCGKAPPSAPDTASSVVASLVTEVVQPVAVPAERELDGKIEAVNQATVSAQTSGRVAEIFFDVNDFVPAGALIIKLRSTESAHMYTTMKNRKNDPNRLELRRYDPTLRKHVAYRESK